MVAQYPLLLPAFSRGFHLITHHVTRALPDLPAAGLLHIFLQHTSAGLAINENADPTVRGDFDRTFRHLVPENQPYYRHTYEGSDDMPAHIQSALVGVSLTIPITEHTLNLGTWQGIYLCEFRNHGGSRRLVLTVYS